MANIQSSSVSYSLECCSCGQEWDETPESSSSSCPRCGAAIEKSSGQFRVASAEPSSERRPSGCWGWAEATQNKP